MLKPSFYQVSVDTIQWLSCLGFMKPPRPFLEIFFLSFHRRKTYAFSHTIWFENIGGRPRQVLSTSNVLITDFELSLHNFAVRISVVLGLTCNWIKDVALGTVCIAAYRNFAWVITFRFEVPSFVTPLSPSVICNQRSSSFCEIYERRPLIYAEYMLRNCNLLC